MIDTKKMRLTPDSGTLCQSYELQQTNAGKLAVEHWWFNHDQSSSIGIKIFKSIPNPDNAWTNELIFEGSLGELVEKITQNEKL